MRQHAGWLVAGILCAFMFAGAAISGPSTPESVNGCVYNATPPTLSDGQVTVDQCDSAGNRKISGTVTITPSGTQPVVGASTAADGGVLTAALKTWSFGGLYNGTTEDLWRGAANSLNSTGTGLATAQVVGQCDDTSPTALTENSFGNARINCSTHSQLVEEPDAPVATGTCSAACNGTTLVSFDTGAAGSYTKTIVYQLTTAGSGAVTMQESNDNSTWVAFNCATVGIQPAMLMSSTNGSFPGIQVCTVHARYWRAQFTGYSSGTFTATAYARQTQNAPTTVQGNVGVLPYPMDARQGTALAVPVSISATGTTAATAATLAGVSGKTTYLCGFSIRANATAAATGNATVANTITGTLNFTQWTAPLATGIGITEPSIGPNCIPASATNTGIVITSAAPGAGGTVSVSAWGFQL